MDHLVVVTHPQPLRIVARPLDHEGLPEGTIALGYFHEGHLIARGIVAPEAMEAINGILERPVSLALAAAEDERGNIDARVCLVLPIEPDMLEEDNDEEAGQEPWRSSVPSLPPGIEDTGAGQSEQLKMALLPIGNVVRGQRDRRHPESIADDAREMLNNLVGGRAQDNVQKAIDDLLRNL